MPCAARSRQNARRRPCAGRKTDLRAVCFVRASGFYTGLFLSTLFFGFCCLPLHLLPRPIGYAFMRQWSCFNLWWLALTCGLRYRVEGLEHIHGDEPRIVVCNHQSAWEILALNVLLPRQSFVLKRELLRLPVFNWGLRLSDPIAIDRGAHRKALRYLLEQGANRLQRGLWVVIFPEGTRVEPGHKGRYLPAAGLLAEKTGRAVLAVAHNSGWFWPKNCFWKRPGTIRIVIAPPIDPHGLNARQITRQAEHWIEQTRAQLPAA